MPAFVINDWGDTNRPTTADPGALFNGLIDAAGGRALPGRWGLVQAILTCCAQPRHGTHPALHWTKTVLNLAGIARDYRRAADPARAETYHDPIQEWIEAHGLSIPSRLEQLGSMLLAYSTGLPHQDVKPGKDDDQEYLRTFTLPGGFSYTFRLWPGNGNGQEYNWGPYVATANHGAFLDTINEIIWRAEGGGDLQITAQQSQYKSSAFMLSNIGEPSDYVSDEATPWRSLELLTRRCLAFRDRGVNRNILFYGPPGTGKTTLARSVARRIGDGRTLRVEAAAVHAAGVGAVIGFLRVLRPRVVLFDDLDRCMDHVVELLHCMERGEALHGAVLVGTINVVKAVDPALLRPGRFDEVIEIAEPDAGHRVRITEHYLRKYAVAMDAEKLSEVMEGFSPADVREVVQCLAAVGPDHAEAEIGRVARQRALYGGDACEQYALRSYPNKLVKAGL